MKGSPMKYFKDKHASSVAKFKASPVKEVVTAAILIGSAIYKGIKAKKDKQKQEESSAWNRAGDTSMPKLSGGPKGGFA